MNVLLSNESAENHVLSVKTVSLKQLGQSVTH